MRIAPRCAQVDTPAAAEARRASAPCRERYSGRADWNEWADVLRLADVQYELLAGDRGRAEPLREAIRTLLAVQVREFAEEPFLRLAKALDVRAQELTPIPAAEWPSACDERAEHYTEPSVEDLEAARLAFQRRLDALAAWMPALGQPGSRWAQFLFWDESRDLASRMPKATPDAKLLDRLEVRWKAAPTVWDEERLFETSLAAQTYIRLLRSFLVGETQAQYAAAWHELGEWLVTLEADRWDTSKVAAAVARRESLAQASRLTASIRRELSRPNLIIQVRGKWLESQLKQPIDEPYDVNGVFAGTRSVGSGRMRGTMWGEFLPSTAVGRWVLRLSATSTARTTGSQEGVSVVSRATTRVAATKPFRMDARGLIPQRANAGATTSITYESINSSGFGRRRSRAVSETYARRPQAEADGAAYARRSILETINEEAAKVAGDFNKTYHAQLRDPRLNALRPAPLIRVAAADEMVRWECLLEAPAGFGAPLPPPADDPGTEVVMCLGASALEEQAAITLGGRQMTGAELTEALGSALGTAAAGTSDEFHVTFEQDPCDVRFEEDVIHVRLHINKFDSADVNYPAMTVDVGYQPQQRDGQVVFVRQGRLRVTPLAGNEDEGQPTRMSGRQQTLRLAVQRKLGKVLSEELTAASIDLPLAGEKQTALRVEQARMVGPWLQLGLSPAPES